MLEVSLAAASTLCTLGSSCAALVDCSISAPLVMAASQDMALSCLVDPTAGQLVLASGAHSAVRKHMAVHTGELAQTGVPIETSCAVWTSLPWEPFSSEPVAACNIVQVLSWRSRRPP